MQDTKSVEEHDVRRMLGLADKTKIIELLKDIFQGDEKNSLKILKQQVTNGIDAKNFLNDVLEILYHFSRQISLGSIEKDMSISEAENEMIEKYSKNLDIQDIGLFWQLTLKTIDDLKIIGNESLALEMFIMQLAHLKKIRKSDDIRNEESFSIRSQENPDNKKIIDKNLDTNNNQTKNQLRSTNQIKSKPINNFSEKNIKTKIEITNFKDLIDQANNDKEIELKYDLERNVKLVSFSKGQIDISFNEKLNKNFIKNLTDKLFKWTNERWIISLSKNLNAKSIYEQNLEDKNKLINEFKNNKISKDIESAFPDAKLVDIVEDKDK